MARTLRRFSLDLPTLTVETTDGYQPALAEIIAFADDAVAAEA